MKRIAVIPNNSKDIGLVNTKRLVEFLNGKAEIYIDEAYSVLGLNVNYVAESEILDNAEYLIVLGGDGTILQRAAECAKRKIPVLGINLGKIGFMTEIEIDDMEGEKLIYMELSTDGVAVNRYTADGLIIATPTGSTGYSISAGGPVVDPCMRLYVATPICAHMLSVRSAVLSSNKDIRIKLDGEYGNADAVVTADGDIQGYIKNADEVIITESEYDFELIKIGEQSFYDTLIKKLS